MRLRGDEGDAPVPERPWYREVLEEPDPQRRIRLTAGYSRAVKERIGPLFEVIRGAALADPDIAALWERIQTEFHGAQRAIVQGLQAQGALRRGLDVERATDVLWTLNHPATWQLLVAERGWTPAEWEEWFTDAATSQLLGDG